jgi:hypothetical protein
MAQAYFAFETVERPGEFVFMLTDETLIAHARRILSDKEEHEVHVRGSIVKRQMPYNRPWSFHLDPTSIQFFATANEACDAPTQYVEDHLDEAGGVFLPRGQWCPWSSRLIREVTPETAGA